MMMVVMAYIFSARSRLAKALARSSSCCRDCVCFCREGPRLSWRPGAFSFRVDLLAHLDRHQPLHICDVGQGARQISVLRIRFLEMLNGAGKNFGASALRPVADTVMMHTISDSHGTFGPHASLYDNASETKVQRKELYCDGLRTNKSYRWQHNGDELIEIPVTTFPVAKVPIHISYILYLSMFDLDWHYFTLRQLYVYAGVGNAVIIYTYASPGFPRCG